MLCKIADLFVEVPEAGGLAPRLREYSREDYQERKPAEIIIREDLYEPQWWKDLSYGNMCYMESGYQFYSNLIKFNGMKLHASAVAWKERAYLFSAPCGTGKSTHRKMWQQLYGEDAAIVFNDDKPALRLLDGKWYAYGTPWCGKEGINSNMKVPLAGICFLEQAPENRIRRMKPAEVISSVIDQTNWRWRTQNEMVQLLDNVDKLIQQIPVFLLECTPTTDAAKLSSETMSKAADEAGL